MRKSNAKISVCMAVYNGERFLNQQISSILPQLSVDDELIVSDQGSTDDSVGIIERLNDSRIKLVQATKPLISGWSNTRYRNSIYAAANFENALKHATGEIIFFSDQDDVWLPDKVEAVLSEFLNPLTWLVVHDAYITDENLNRAAKSLFEERRARPGIWKNLLTSSYFGSTMAFRSWIVKHGLPFPHNLPCHDLWLGLLTPAKHTLFLPKKLTLYRRHSATVTALEAKNIDQTLQKITYRLVLLQQIVFRRLSGKCSDES